MERSERIPTKGLNSTFLAIKAGLDGRQAKIWTAVPAIVQSFNAEKITVEAQPAIQAQIRQPNGTWVDTNLPLCVDCPVMFPGGGGFQLSFPLAKSDEGLLVFASRCIDAWWQNGGIQKQAELRMHDLSDGFFLPTGGMSNPNVVGNISTENAQLRNKAGTAMLEITPQGKIMFTGDTIFNGPVTFLNTVDGADGGGGTINLGNANIVTTGTIKSNDISLSTHTHADVVVGAANSGPPNEGT
jgi:hypothetical protein